jgi:hypothetical protein
MMTVGFVAPAAVSPSFPGFGVKSVHSMSFAPHTGSLRPGFFAAFFSGQAITYSPAVKTAPSVLHSVIKFAFTVRHLPVLLSQKRGHGK